jgi:murein DD-endopeptidase MepM/ murein hydrolase activator NlpD
MPQNNVANWVLSEVVILAKMARDVALFQRLLGHIWIMGLIAAVALFSAIGTQVSVERPTHYPVAVLRRMAETSRDETRITRQAAPVTTIASGPRQDTWMYVEARPAPVTREGQEAARVAAPGFTVISDSPKRDRPALSLTSIPITSTFIAAGGAFGGAGWVNVRLCATASPTRTMASGRFRYPTNSHYIGGFNYGPEHLGIDLSGNLGDPIYAADGGTVAWVGLNPDTPNYGLMVVVDHGNGWMTLYGHLNTMYVRCKQTVLKGTVIGAMGTTGRSSGPHLHFEMWHNGQMPNPVDVLQ